ncbi:MAG: hypothetical protein AAF478_13215 [Pseudomonadota bacterium]
MSHSNVVKLRFHELYAQSGNASQAARAVGISDRTGRNWSKDTVIQFPDFTEEEDAGEPIDDIIDRMSQNFLRRQKAANDRNWFKIKVNETKPYGLLWFGDPHLDDDGCNWPLVKRHCEIAEQEGVYGCNIGDTTNNWVGRLMAKYADQECSKTNADRLAEWFMFDSKVKWLVWLLGNHDLWNNGAHFYKRMCANHVPVIDWQAKFEIHHPSGSRVRIDASHGRKGTSIYNQLHGTLREAVMGEVADLYVTGHTHNFAMEMLEVAQRQHVCWLLQLRGYKFFDDYAILRGFPEHRHGSALFVIIDPSKDAISPVKICFEDVEEGADYLQFLRR